MLFKDVCVDVIDEVRAGVEIATAGDDDVAISVVFIPVLLDRR
jgi:hypothetical protein